MDIDTGAVRGHVHVGGPRRVLLLHGGPGLGHEYLQPLLPELAPWTVATFQQRGLAPSTTDGPFDLDTAVADVVDVLDAAGWDRALLVGHSWGGHLALHCASRLGDRLDGVLAIDPVGGVGDGGLADFGATLMARLDPAQRDRAALLSESADPVLAAEGLALLWPAYFSTPDVAPACPPVRIDPAAAEGLGAAMVAGLPALEASLDSIDVPLGVLMGGASPMPRSAGADVVTRVAGAWLEVVEDCGHFVWLERPGAVAAALERLTVA
ncbi:alpha/beta hydrolase [Nocardioides sp.]|uniref:alpha/beta fold hydrolase n=1 Tax=Nocardioides sp. TaxID=35761 RepID=UPI00286D2866|nr:alpha/beta hydrolase [Nocardioides sp.]